MQQMRIPPAAVSHLRNTLDLIAAIRSHVAESCGDAILSQKRGVRHYQSGFLHHHGPATQPELQCSTIKGK